MFDHVCGMRHCHTLSSLDVKAIERNKRHHKLKIRTTKCHSKWFSLTVLTGADVEKSMVECKYYSQLVSVVSTVVHGSSARCGDINAMTQYNDSVLHINFLFRGLRRYRFNRHLIPTAVVSLRVS